MSREWKMKSPDDLEVKCDACSGTGFPQISQPAEPGRKVYPAPCKKCGGKGRVSKPAN